MENKMDEDCGITQEELDSNNGIFFRNRIDAMITGSDNEYCISELLFEIRNLYETLDLLRNG